MLKLLPSTIFFALAMTVLATVGSGCNGGQPAGSDGTGGGPANSTGGTGGVSGGSGGTAGGGDGTGGVPPNPSGFDDGKLFADAGPPKIPPMDAGTSDGSAGNDGGAGIGMAVKMFPTQGISLSFTQTGADVTMVATHKGCGAFTIQIHGGFSCDNASTQGGVWDGKRGDGITGTVACDMASQTGKLTYTRSGADPTLNWTVGDHNAKTDLTYHPIFVDGNCLTFF